MGILTRSRKVQSILYRLDNHRVLDPRFQETCLRCFYTDILMFLISILHPYLPEYLQLLHFSVKTGNINAVIRLKKCLP